MIESHLLTSLLFIALSALPGEQEGRWWPQSVENRLIVAKDNRQELVKALTSVPKDQQKGMAFLVENMPDSDLLNLKASFLLTNHELAYKAKQQVPWGKEIPDDLFFNNVLPYANLDEKRDPWRTAFFDQCMPMIKDCKTPTEATQKLNSELFKTLKLRYAPQRRAPNLSPAESIAQGNASCTGLSIVLSDACRAVCIPTRIVGTPNWYDKRGNHTWLEIHDGGWHFTGACEADPNGLDRGWFVGDAAKAKHDSPEHAIYATSFRRTTVHFPLVWARDVTTVPGENITDRYAKKATSPSSTVTSPGGWPTMIPDTRRMSVPAFMQSITGGGVSPRTPRPVTTTLPDLMSPSTPAPISLTAPSVASVSSDTRGLSTTTARSEMAPSRKALWVIDLSGGTATVPATALAGRKVRLVIGAES